MIMNVMQILNSDEKKHLRELLTQDQEPFHLHNYIADKRSFITHKKPQHDSSNTCVKSNTKTTHSSSRSCFYKQTCFSSLQQHYSPDIINTSSPIKNNSSVFHVSPKTATQLVQAATKIHKQSSKTKHKYPGLVLFSSILKKLKDKHKTDKFANNIKENYHGNCNNCSSRISSAGWSEDDEEEDNKSKETISSCSTTTRSDFNNQDIISFVLPCSCDDQPHLFLSPLSSPFRFALHTSPSSTSRPTPEFISPEASPCHHSKQENIDDQACDDIRKDEHEEEDEKEQCSPVSVLDLPFEDDGQDGKEAEDDEYDYDLEHSYAIMQKSKLQLLERLRRFERLAELEPIELERRMLEGYDNDEDSDHDDYLDENEEREEVDECRLNADNVIGEVFSGTSPRHVEEVPGHMKRLVVDLVAEEKRKGMNNRNEVIVKMMCKRLDSWKQVESNTVEMMVEMDIRREFKRWDSYEEEIGDRAKEIEVAIFSSLVDEISEELASH